MRDNAMHLLNAATEQSVQELLEVNGFASCMASLAGKDGAAVVAMPVEELVTLTSQVEGNTIYAALHGMNAQQCHASSTLTQTLISSVI